ncbi:hypothetical protein F4778DRAFT_758417 [Xylariomycetidae sp. FL2044]|nr:hypothetical protein F4778DRAFT_758417 [Xylariomycetidae sp. FL2044]
MSNLIYTPPTLTTPLVSSKSKPNYSTMRPKLSLIIPPAPQTQPRLLTANECFVVDVESFSYIIETAYTHEEVYGRRRSIVCCDFCTNHNLQHGRAGDHRHLWRRCTESEGLLGFVESLIEFQMKVLAVVVPLLLLFVLRVYMMG